MPIVKAIQQGTYLKTQMIRVDADYAAAIKKEAKDAGVKVTEYTRFIYEMMYAK